MAKTNEIQFNVKNVKYAVKDPITGEYEAPKDLAYAEAIALEAVFSTQDVYGDGVKIATLASDQGMTGTLTLVQPAPQYEIDMGRKKEIDGGIADVTQLDSVEHAIYYEVEAVVNGTKSTIKTWLYNVISGRPSETFTQTKENPTLNNIEVALTINGDDLMDSAGTAVYVDAGGNSQKAIKLTAKPSDTGYATFGAAVPVPKVKAA